LMSSITTDPPPRTKREAAPKPRPDTPPVTSATEPSIFTPTSYFGEATTDPVVVLLI
jgi:hypothetical protein